MSALISITLLRKAITAWTLGDKLNVADTIAGLSGSATFNPASLVDGAGETTTITVTDAELGDFALASAPYDLQGITVTAYVSASNTVAIRLQNETTSTINLASGTWRARVVKAV